MGAEHPAVAVALVHDDIAQRAQERRPPAVPGQQGPVQHVGVGQHVRRVLADPVAILRRSVAVVRRRAQPWNIQGVEGTELVGCQCFRR